MKGAISKRAFELYVEHFLAPGLKKGQMVVDDLQTHKGEKVHELFEVRKFSSCHPPHRTPAP